MSFVELFQKREVVSRTTGRQQIGRDEACSGPDLPKYPNTIPRHFRILYNLDPPTGVSCVSKSGAQVHRLWKSQESPPSRSARAPRGPRRFAIDVLRRDAGKWTAAFRRRGRTQGEEEIAVTGPDRPHLNWIVPVYKVLYVFTLRIALHGRGRTFSTETRSGGNGPEPGPLSVGEGARILRVI